MNSDKGLERFIPKKRGVLEVVRHWLQRTDSRGTMTLERRELVQYNLIEMTDAERYALSITNIPPSLFYSDNRWIQKVVDKLKGYVPNAKQRKEPYLRAVKWFATQGTRAMKLKASGFYVHMSRDSYTGTVCKIGYKPVAYLLEELERDGYIDLYRGYGKEFNEGKPSERQQSFVHLTEKGRELWEGSRYDLVAIPEEPGIRVKDTENGEYKMTQGMSGVVAKNRTVKGLNKMNAKTTVTYNGKYVAPVEYYRVFHDTLEKHGRFYAAGGGVQLLPQIERRELLQFNGEKVVELDYSSMHPNLLYEELSVSGELASFLGSVREVLGGDFKPYAANVSGLIDVDQWVVDEHRKNYAISKYDPVRTLLKKALIISINSQDRAQAAAALLKDFLDDLRKEEHSRMYVGISKGFQSWAVCDAVRSHNNLIEESFYNNEGERLMTIDGNICERVVNKMVFQEEPIYLYHDSFIVREGACDLLYSAMRDAWAEEMGGNDFCKVDQK